MSCNCAPCNWGFLCHIVRRVYISIGTHVTQMCTTIACFCCTAGHHLFSIVDLFLLVFVRPLLLLVAFAGRYLREVCNYTKRHICAFVCQCTHAAFCFIKPCPLLLKGAFAGICKDVRYEALGTDIFHCDSNTRTSTEKLCDFLLDSVLCHHMRDHLGSIALNTVRLFKSSVITFHSIYVWFHCCHYVEYVLPHGIAGIITAFICGRDFTTEHSLSCVIVLGICFAGAAMHCMESHVAHSTTLPRDRRSNSQFAGAHNGTGGTTTFFVISDGSARIAAPKHISAKMRRLNNIAR